MEKGEGVRGTGGRQARAGDSPRVERGSTEFSVTETRGGGRWAGGAAGEEGRGDKESEKIKFCFPP